MTATDGLLVVDKPAGPTSHDVVAAVRRLAGTRKVGHAGTLDPMATGVLILGIGRATRLLGYLAQGGKSYTATIRLGIGTVTDDAQGSVLETPGCTITDRDTLEHAVQAFRGPISQVPSAVSAVKVAGRRSYELVRAGEDVVLKPRDVTVYSFDLHDVRTAHVDAAAPDAPVTAIDVVDVDVTVACSSGTYIRALARDLGAALGTAGHLTALRRTQVGPWDLGDATPLGDLVADELPMIDLSVAANRAFPAIHLDEESAERVRHGARLPWGAAPDGPLALFDPAGHVLALAEARDARLMPLAVLA